MATLRSRAWLALFALLGASAAGCGDRAKELRDLDGREFLSESVEGQTLVDGTQIRIRFEDGNVNVHAGCNHQAGAYEIDGDELVVGGFGGTQIGCDPDLHAQDSWIAELLTARPRVELVGARLILNGDGIELVLLDREMASPDRPLVGTLWKGNGFGEVGGGVTFAPGVDMVSLRFNQRGNEGMEVFTGCRNGSGRFTTGDGWVELEEVVYDQIACSGPTGTIDMAVTQLLDDGTLSFEIEERSLTLTKESRLLLFRSAE